MAYFGCGCQNTCTSIAIVTSIIVGVIAAFLRIMAVITVTSAFLWVTLGIAVVYLGILLIGALFTANNCGRSSGAILSGILGTILLSIVLLAIPFAATSITGAVLTGILLFFFSLLITATACWVFRRV